MSFPSNYARIPAWMIQASSQPSEVRRSTRSAPSHTLPSPHRPPDRVSRCSPCPTRPCRPRPESRPGGADTPGGNGARAWVAWGRFSWPEGCSRWPSLFCCSSSIGSRRPPAPTSWCLCNPSSDNLFIYFAQLYKSPGSPVHCAWDFQETGAGYQQLFAGMSAFPGVHIQCLR